MEPCTSPESQGKNYADYIDAIQREAFLKSLKQAEFGGGPPGNRLGKALADADLIRNTPPVPDQESRD